MVKYDFHVRFELENDNIVFEKIWRITIINELNPTCDATFSFEDIPYQKKLN